MVATRPINWQTDSEAVIALDISFSTDRIYQLVQTDRSFALEEQPVSPPLRKVYSIAELREEIGRMEFVHVAEVEGHIAGLIAARFEPWNRRVEVHYLYVDARQRRQGVGAALLAAATAYARSVQARCLWLETQNVNYPAIQFYRRLGFRLCGLDTTLYNPESEAGDEVALFFTRAV